MIIRIESYSGMTVALAWLAAGAYRGSLLDVAGAVVGFGFAWLWGKVA